MSSSNSLSSPESQRRPGPFGPAKELLIKGQELVKLHQDDDLYKAISELNFHDFSQAPVVDEEGHIVGLYTERKLSDFIDEMGEKERLQFSNYKVKDVMDRSPKIIHPDHYIDTDIDWGITHAVIVGTKEEPIGILTVWDIWGHLNDFAETFVLVYELEICVRQLIRLIMGDDLQESLSQWKYSDGRPTPQALEQFTFQQYQDFLGQKEVWPRWVKLGLGPRRLVMNHLDEANELRNQIMHFRQAATPEQTDRLRKIRDKFFGYQSDAEAVVVVMNSDDE